MPDLAELVGGGPSSQARQVLRGRVSRPPANADDSLEVLVPSFSGALSYEIPASNWLSGGLPTEGAGCLVVIDSDGDAWMPVWDGFTPLDPVTTAFPRGSSVTSQSSGTTYTTNTGTEAAMDTTNLRKTVTTNGDVVTVRISGGDLQSTTVPAAAGFSLYVDGVFKSRRYTSLSIANWSHDLDVEWTVQGLTAGPHVFEVRWYGLWSTSGTISLARSSTYPVDFIIQEGWPSTIIQAKGDTGAAGAAGFSDIGATFGLGANTASTASAWLLMPFPVIASQQGDAGAIVRNSDGTVTIRDAGTYAISVSGAFSTQNTGARRILRLVIGTDPNSNIIAQDERPTVTGGFPTATVTYSGYLAAGTILSLQGYTDATATRAVQNASIMRGGTGPQGPQGPAGVGYPPYKYAEANGGADVALPNTGVWVDVLDSAGTPLAFSIITGASPEVWHLEGQTLCRADSTNDTPFELMMYTTQDGNGSAAIDQTYQARTQHGRGYFASASPNLNAWEMMHVQRTLTIPANTTKTYRMAARIAAGSFGGYYYRATAAYTNFEAVRRA